MQKKWTAAKAGFISFSIIYLCSYIGAAETTALDLISSQKNLASETSLVALDNMITDFEARLALARLLAYSDDTLDEALKEYKILLEEQPYNTTIRLEIAKVYVRQQKYQKALKELNFALSRNPRDPKILIEMAEAEAISGHAKKCRQLYLDALNIVKNSEELSLRFADRMNMWGDFYKAEKIYRDYLKNHPESTKVTLKLAWVLASSQRYEEAEGVYRKLLLKISDSDKVLLGLARLKFLEKDFDSSLAYLQKALSRNLENPEGLLLKGDTLFYVRRYKEALQTYGHLAKIKSYQVPGLLGIGKVYLKQKKLDLAKTYFEKAYQIDQENVEIQFYHTGLDMVISNDFLKKILEPGKESSMKLEQWAQLYASYGFKKMAIACYEAALKQDPQYFPAQIGLAEILSVDYQYDRSVALFKALAADFPAASKILIGWARVLGWSKQYRKSMDLYEKIQQLNPADPVPQIEKARTAVWGKRIGPAMETYRKMLSPSVDQELVSALKPIASQAKDPSFTENFNLLKYRAEEGSIYQGYEEFTKGLEHYKGYFSPDQKMQVDLIVTELLPVFKIQKAVYLESQAKQLSWDKRYTKAMDVYEELIPFKLGNEEAIFDYAQVECTLGLCDRAAKTYEELLNIDPLHNLATMALEREKIRHNIFLQLDHSYWREDGRGELAQITRNSTDLILDIPIYCRYHLRLMGHNWIEKPNFNNESYSANGYTLEFSGILNPYLKGEVGWINKRYTEREFGTKDTGYSHLWFNLRDYVQLGFGYDKTDEIYNYFGIKQGIQANSWWVSAASNINRQLSLNGQAKYLKYNDDNKGERYSLGVGYAFTDLPRIFKITLNGEYRDTRYSNVFNYLGGTLVDIKHPYWTPQNYAAEEITFEWHHDVSKFLICGSKPHFYDLKLSLGTDTENNPAFRIEGEWHKEFKKHWTVGFKGMLHRSKEWDVDAFWFLIKYQF